MASDKGADVKLFEFFLFLLREVTELLLHLKVFHIATFMFGIIIGFERRAWKTASSPNN